MRSLVVVDVDYLRDACICIVEAFEVFAIQPFGFEYAVNSFSNGVVTRITVLSHANLNTVVL